MRCSQLDTYWQSDGSQPHFINIEAGIWGVLPRHGMHGRPALLNQCSRWFSQFSKRQPVALMSFYIDYNIDESYTPKKIVIRVGSCTHDVVEVVSVEFNEPSGWVDIDLRRDAQRLSLWL